MLYKVRELREQKHMTQEDLAKESGVSRATICNLENGNITTTKVATLEKIAAALGEKVGSIFLV